MGTTYRFIADPSEPYEALEWFRSLPVPPQEERKARGVILYFKEQGALALNPEGGIEVKASPVVSVVLPQVRRGILWSLGEVHFLATPLRQKFPGLHKIGAAFSKWLATQECVYSNKRQDNEFAYFLEGSVKNYDSPVYAFSSGLVALRAGRYFVGEGDGEAILDATCKALRLRGVECAGP
jgi:hypothetical protein